MNIFFQIFSQSKEKALDAIIKTYKTQGFVIIHYLYFANLVTTGLIGKQPLNTAFQKALQNADYVLPDGIALRMYARKWFDRVLPNLNGTDFSAYYLTHLDPDDVEFVLYGGTQEVVMKAKIYVESHGHRVVYAQQGYEDFDFQSLHLLNPHKMSIFLVGLGTPKQEIFVESHRDIIQQYGLVVFSQGGTFDFWAGNEIRAPKIIQSIKCEWLWRFVLNPKKNARKVLNSLHIFYYLLVRPKDLEKK